MKWIFYNALLCLVALNLSFADKNINKIIDERGSTNIGVMIYDLDTSTTIFERNANKNFIPASNMKLFSDAAALLILGPKYQFTTTLSTDAKLIDKSNLHGSLYLKFSNDPTFSRDDLRFMLKELTKLNIKNITGNIILVPPFSKITAPVAGRSAKDAKQSYGAPIIPFIIDENRLTVSVHPSELYKRANIEVNDDLAFIPINNLIDTKNNASCGFDLTLDEENVLKTKGCIHQKGFSILSKIPIINPFIYTQRLIKNELKDLGISFNGQIKLGPINNTLLLASHSSKPLAKIVADTLKPSDNLYADALYLTAAGKLKNGDVSWEEAQILLKNFLQDTLKINLNSAILADGSGLSRNNRITPKQTIELLKFFHQHFPLSYEYISALPIGGVDGTLQKKFQHANQRGMIRAKTGTLAGVVSLSGFLKAANNHTLAFAIYINPNPKGIINDKASQIIEALCNYFLKGRAQSLNLGKNDSFSWRKIEIYLRNNVNNIAVVYKKDGLLITDYNKDHSYVLNKIKSLNQKNNLAIILQQSEDPQNKESILWIKKASGPRTWILRQTVS